MIIVNVDITMLGKNMSFRIDEMSSEAEIRSAISETIHESGEARLVQDRNGYFLWDKSGRLLDVNRTGAENGLASGSSLVFA